MSTGTITLTKGSTAVTGSGTLFTTELAVNGFIVATVGGTAYTLGIKAIASNTTLTLTQAYDGPTTSGVAFDYVPLATLNLITSALASQVSYAIRGLNLDKNNWQSIFTGSGTVTVTLPDGTTWTGPAWGGITSSLNSLATDVGNKAAKGANSDITSLSGLTTPLSKAQGGTGLNSPFGTAADTFCQGNDSRLNTVASKTGGQITSSIDIVGDIFARRRASSEPSTGTGISGNYLYSIHNIAGVDRVVSAMNASYVWGNTSATLNLNSQLYGSGGNVIQSANYAFSSNGSATAPGQWVNNSDERIKTNINRIEDPLGKMTQFRGVSWDRLDGYAGGLGFIAQEVRNVFPGSVFESGIDRTLTDGTVVENVLSVDSAGVAAALHHEAILALMEEVNSLKAEVSRLMDELGS